MTNKKYAEMTGYELLSEYSGAPRGMSMGDAMAALRDAIRTEAREELASEIIGKRDQLDALRARAERAERERDSAVLELESTKEFLRLSRNRRDALKMQLTAAERERDAAKREAAGFKAWVQRAESALGEARREGARELVAYLYEGTDEVLPREAEAWVDGRYPATPSGEGVTYSTQGPTGYSGPRATPQPSEPLVIPVEPDLELKIWDRPETLRITITPDLARRIVTMGQEETYL